MLENEENKNAPLVSVIIPCYNAEKYVEQAVCSIINQTYKNLEIIVTDDCSTDSTFEILQWLAKQDSRIKLYKNEENLKIVKTLNNMILQSRGKYIARMDADDISLPKRIEKQVEFLENHKDYGFCGTNAFYINENGEKIRVSHLPITAEENLFCLGFYSSFIHPSVLIRSEIYKENLYDENFLYAEDYELWVRLTLNKGIKGGNLKEQLFEYRFFEKQTSSVFRKEQIDSVHKIFTSYFNLSDKESDFHKNIFLTYKSSAQDETFYIKKLIKKMKKQRFSKGIFVPYQILALHILHNATITSNRYGLGGGTNSC